MYATLVRAQKLNNQELLQVLLSGFTGLLICLLSSAIGNAALVEISVNIVFSAVPFLLTLVFWHLLHRHRRAPLRQSEQHPRVKRAQSSQKLSPVLLRNRVPLWTALLLP